MNRGLIEEIKEQFFATGTQIYGNMQLYKVEIFKQDDEENICTKEELNIGSLEKAA
jgi:hypothetical protein